mgnify:CR=1 FL=1
MNDVSKIWWILNKAVKSKIPVYDLALSCRGLPRETILELAEKLSIDMNTNKRKQEINKWKLDKTNEELERRIKNENLLDLRIQHR